MIILYISIAFILFAVLIAVVSFFMNRKQQKRIDSFYIETISIPKLSVHRIQQPKQTATTIFPARKQTITSKTSTMLPPCIPPNYESKSDSVFVTPPSIVVVDKSNHNDMHSHGGSFGGSGATGNWDSTPDTTSHHSHTADYTSSYDSSSSNCDYSSTDSGGGFDSGSSSSGCD